VPSLGAAGAVAVALVGVAVLVTVEVSVLVALVVLVVEESLLPLSLPPQAAVSVLRAITAAIPAAAEKRRVVRVSIMVNTPFVGSNPCWRVLPILM
jgi:hypothetical protein